MKFNFEFAEKISRTYSDECRPLCHELKLPQTAFDILMFLANNPEYKTARDIVEIRKIKANLVSVNVDKLVNEGYLERKPVENDRRKTELVCTKKAGTVIERGRRIQQQFTANLFAGVDEEQKKQLTIVMEQLENNMDEILGILYQKDFHNSILRTDTLIREAVRPVLFVAKNKKIGDLMKELQQKKLHIAIVMDEYGGTAGIVTLEDILEELVGEIWDEHDEVVSEMEQLGENEYRVSGKANVEKIFERLHMEKDFDVLTVSGWVMEQLGCIPTEGDSFESDGLKVIVTKMWGKRIGEVRILVDLS